MHVLYNRIQRINRLFTVLTGWFVGCLCVVVLYDVLFRYIFAKPLGWAVDFGELVMLPIIYLPAAYISKERGHVSIDVLINRLPARAKRVFEIFGSLMGICFSALLGWQAVIIFCDVYIRNTVTMMGKLPVYPAAMFFVIGVFLLFVQEILNLLENIYILRENEDDKFKTEHNY